MNISLPPRVLFITPAAFNRTTGGGITFGNLFAGWPKDRLATAHNDPVPTTTETCELYYRLGPREIRRWGPLERLAPIAGSRGTASPGSAAPRRTRATVRWIKEAVFGEQLPDTGALSPELERWIERFRPEVLYTILGTNAMMALVEAVQRRFELPLVIHMMDDWPETSYRRGMLGLASRTRMQRQIGRLMTLATERFGICDSMCAAYRKRYGVPFIAFQNAVDVAHWPGREGADLRSRNAADVVYVGSVLASAQLDSLVDCCHAVARLARDGVKVRLSIYSPATCTESHRDRLLVSPEISLHDTITDDEAFFQRIQGADALVLPVNFSHESVRYLRYSMPTKVPAYLASGTPILAYGPDSVAQIRYAEEHGWAHVVTRRGVDSVAEGLRQLLSDGPLRARISANARATALARHDSAVVRAAFQERLLRAAARRPEKALR